MRICIVDDEAEELFAAKDYVLKHIEEYYPQIYTSVAIDDFSSAEEFLKNFDSQYDLLILDIRLQGASGMEAARMVREKDASVAIVFLTSSREYVLEGYGVFATGYFLKPLEDNGEDFKKTFAHILGSLKERNKSLAVRSEGAIFSVPYSNIFFIDIDWRHRLRLHLEEKSIIVSMGYENAQKELLTDSRFLECHHRILVNMDKIASMKKEEFVLTNGERVPISQRKQKESKARYMGYFVRNGNYTGEC